MKIAQFVLLIPPTTVKVEAGFSILNNIQNNKRNKLSENTLNMIMMMKMNIDENTLNTVINDSATKWLY
jgi:hypothetical protein